MTRFGYDDLYYNYGVYAIYPDGITSGVDLVSNLVTRPVFYLEPEVEYLSGTGTLEDPIMIVE